MPAGMWRQCYLDPLASGRLDQGYYDAMLAVDNLDPLASGRLDREKSHEIP